MAGLIAEVNWTNPRSTSTTTTVAQLCSHFEQRELARNNRWRSYSTKACYAVYLRRWTIPNWRKLELRDVRTIEFESWLRRLPLAKSRCAKIRGVMSVLFNHACRYEFFDRNPIRLVRQGAKRKAAPNVLTPDEIKTLIDGLAIRERTLVLLAASTGLRQSELFGLKWRDIDFVGNLIHVTRSIVCGVVGPCKTESSQKPVPVHPLTIETLVTWKEQQRYHKPDDLVFASGRYRGRKPYWGPGDLAKIHPAKSARVGYWKTLRMAHVQAHVFDSPSERGNGIQGDAGVVATFLTAIDLGHLHSGDHSVKACCSGRRNVAHSVSARNPTCRIVRHQWPAGINVKRAQIFVLLHPLWLPPIPYNIFGMYGGDDGARTALLRCGRPFVRTDPGINVRRFNLISGPVRICLQDEFHPPFKIPNIPAVVVDIPVDCFLGKHGELHALVLHVRRHLNAAKNVRLANLVELDCVAPSPHLFSMLYSSTLKRIHQMSEPGTFSKTPRSS